MVHSGVAFGVRQFGAIKWALARFDLGQELERDREMVHWWSIMFVSYRENYTSYPRRGAGSARHRQHGGTMWSWRSMLALDRLYLDLRPMEHKSSFSEGIGVLFI